MNDIEIDGDVLSARGGHGESVATITVKRADGKIQRFFVRLTTMKSGNVACQVSAVRLPQDPSNNRYISPCDTKSVVGRWYPMCSIR